MENPCNYTIENMYMTLLRQREPKTRARGIIYYSLSTGSRKILSCKICNCKVTSWATAYPMTKRAEKASEDHRDECLNKWYDSLPLGVN